MSNAARVESQFKHATEAYAELGVDTTQAIEALGSIPISLHCWQGDDVAGFEGNDGITGGGIMATGNYPGRARTPQELQQDLEKVFAMVPGSHRVNLHAIYGDFGGKKVDRDAIGIEHFQGWIDWAKAQGLGLDFNPSLFSHPLAANGFTLSSLDPDVRAFWVEHCIRSRQISAEMGKQLGTPCVNNVWIPDGYKDLPIDRCRHRELLVQSLDLIFAEDVPREHVVDAVENKLFGIGSEACVIGSLEFYLGYAISRNKLMCLDTGHFHPTEVVSDKISSVLQYVDEILLHVSRGLRWDSDHVLVMSEELLAICQEIVRNDYLSRTHIGLDFFDASINRVGAWTIGTRAILKTLLQALLEPTETLRQLEAEEDFTTRLACLEELKTMPWMAVWDYYCLKQGVPVGSAWIDELKQYEQDVQFARK